MQPVNPSTNNSPLLTYKEAAGYLGGVSVFTVRNLVEQGHLRAVKLGPKVRRLRRCDLDALADTGIEGGADNG